MGVFLAGDEISRPVKHYVAETYRKRLAGVFSASLRMASDLWFPWVLGDSGFP